MPTPSPNTASSRQLREDAKRQTSVLQQEREALEWILNDARGRRFLYRLVYDFCQLEDSSYHIRPTGQGADTVFNEGLRHCGRLVVNECREIHPRLWLMAYAEAVEREEQDRLTRKAIIPPEGEDDAP